MVDQTGMSEKPARRPSDRETPRPRNPHRAESWQPTALRRVRVRAVEPLAPELVRVTLEGDELGEIATDAGDAVPAAPVGDGGLRCSPTAGRAPQLSGA